MQEIVQLIAEFISTVGFPIAAFCMMWYQNQKTTKAITELSSTVQANTSAINELKEKINIKGE